MTLDNAISDFEKMIKNQENTAAYNIRHGGTEYAKMAKANKKKASEYRQLAEWLNELKAYKEQSGDAISRQAVLNTIGNVPDYDDGMVWEVLSHAQRDVALLPSATPQPKTGRWIIKEGREQGYDIAGVKTWYVQIMCDKCGFIKTVIEGHTGQYKFCPNCGAKMQEVEEK